MPRRREIGRIPDEIEDLFAELWQVPRFSGLRHGFRPQADAYRQEDPPALVIVLELAGVDPARVRVEATADGILVAGERPRPELPGPVYQIEIEYGTFERRFRFAEEVDTTAASATYERGLLTVTLPLADRRRGPVSVPVEVRDE